LSTESAPARSVREGRGRFRATGSVAPLPAFIAEPMNAGYSGTRAETPAYFVRKSFIPGEGPGEAIGSSRVLD
jgi:hypothetical protein